MNALEAIGLTKTFKSGKRYVRAVDGVDFCVREGEIFGLLGMNGAGKSTVIRMCTGLLTPDSGSASVYGHDIVKERTAAKKLINVSPQETAVASMLTVRENLIFCARIYGADKLTANERADEIMRTLGIEDRAKDRAGKLSGGLMRRLSIGMALITEPKLVFLDEPTLGLDVLARRELWSCIKHVAERAAVVLTTHYLEEAERLCDRIAVMTRGKVVACDTPDALVATSGENSFEDMFIKLAGEEVVRGE